MRTETANEGHEASLTGMERTAFVLVLILYLGLSLLVFNQIAEDAFIDFRLTENLVEGYGFVFNRGGEPVEAASSLLWMILLALVWHTPLDIVIGAKLLGIASGCVSLWLLLCISRRQIRDPVLRFAPLLLTVASTPFLMWSQRGLETPLVALLVSWLALCCTDARPLRWWPVVGVLLLLARPEGPLFLLALAPVLLADGERRRRAVAGMVVVAVAAVALFAARFLYFHDLVPSPFYVKLQLGPDDGLQQVRRYFVHNHVWLLGIPFALVAWRRGFWTRERLALGVLILVTVVWCVLARDYMAYARHLVPAIPLVYVLAAAGAGELFAAAGRAHRALAVCYLLGGFVLTLAFSRSVGEFNVSRENALARYARAFAADPAAFVASTYVKLRSPNAYTYLDGALQRQDTIGTNYQPLVGEFLRRNYPADAVVVYDQMGQTPFYAGASMRFVDSLGLTDRTIGRFYFERSHPGGAFLGWYDAVVGAAVESVFGERREEIGAAEGVDYLFGLRPDVIMIQSLIVRLDPGGIPAHLSRDPRLREGYQLRHRLARFVEVYERKDLRRSAPLDVPAGLFILPP